MDSARWGWMQEVFHLISDLPGPQQREQLHSVCAADPAMMHDLLAMLREDTRQTSLLDGALPEAVGNLFATTSLAPAQHDLGPYRILRLLGEDQVASSETIQAIAVLSPTNVSAVSTATYTINTVAGSMVTVLTNANGNITGVPSADGLYYVTATYNNANRLASTTGTAAT